MIRLTVLYPAGDGLTFNMDYYLKTHIPLFQKRMGAALKDIRVETGPSARMPNSPASYVAIVYGSFESRTAFETAFAPHAAEILGDVRNYTNIQPVVQISPMVDACPISNSNEGNAAMSTESQNTSISDLRPKTDRGRITLDSRILAVIEYVHAHHGDNLSIDMLAGGVDLSSSRLAHLFKEITGHSVMKYVKRVRLETGRCLLETTDLSIKAIAAAVNMPDRSHFVRDFCQIYGVSPTRWRSSAGRGRSAEFATK